MTELAKPHRAALEAWLACGLIAPQAAQRAVGAPIYYVDEFIDLFPQVPADRRALLFPLIEPEHYARLYGVTGPLEQLEDFLTAGPLARKWPHPLVRLDFALTLRPDLAAEMRTAAGLFALIGDGVVALSPWLSAHPRRALAQLCDQQLDARSAAWIDPHFLRRQYGDCVGSDWDAILHYASLGDARGDWPSASFNAHVWAEDAALTGPLPLQPFAHFLWQGRIAGFPQLAPFLGSGLAGSAMLVDADRHSLPSDRRFFQVTAQSGDAAGGAQTRPTLAVALHIFYLDVSEAILLRLARSDWPMALYVTTSAALEGTVRARLDATGLPYALSVVENRGRDVAPFLNVLPRIVEDGHPFVLKLHTKKSTHRLDGVHWATHLFDALTSPDSLGAAITALMGAPDIGFVGPSGHVLPVGDFIGPNDAQVGRLLQRLGLRLDRCRLQGHFVAGTMLLARVSALAPLMSLGLQVEDFEREEGQLDGTLAHAVERILAVSGWCVGQKLLVQGGGAENLKNRSRFYGPPG